MRVLIDTNMLTDLFRGKADVVYMVERASEVYIPFISMAETKAGYLCGNRVAENERILHQFLAEPGVKVSYPDQETTEVYARLFAQLRRAGTPIPTNDIWIASLGVQHHLTLLSRDEHFDKLPQLLRP